MSDRYHVHIAMMWREHFCFVILFPKPNNPRLILIDIRQAQIGGHLIGYLDNSLQDNHNYKPNNN